MRIWAGAQTAIPMPWFWGNPSGTGFTIPWNARSGDGKWKFVIQKDGYLKDRTTVAGRARHLEEIGHTEGGFYADPENLKLVQERLQKYKNKQFKRV